MLYTTWGLSDRPTFWLEVGGRGKENLKKEREKKKGKGKGRKEKVLNY
jgi:hypothetical protein